MMSSEKKTLLNPMFRKEKTLLTSWSSNFGMLRVKIVFGGLSESTEHDKKSINFSCAYLLALVKKSRRYRIWFYRILKLQQNLLRLRLSFSLFRCRHLFFCDRHGIHVTSRTVPASRTAQGWRLERKRFPEFLPNLVHLKQGSRPLSVPRLRVRGER